MGIIQQYQQFYLRNYKILLWIPVMLSILAVVLLLVHYQQTGDLMNKDVSLKGGITATMYAQQEIDLIALRSSLEKSFDDVDVKRLAEFGSNVPIGVIVEISELDEIQLKQALEDFLKIELTNDNYSVEVVGSSLGESFYRQMLTAILVAFLFMGIVVFFLYRTAIPSMAVIGAAFADITITLAIVNILGVKVSAAGISALLLLIGYSVDSDILQTSRMLKRSEGSVEERMFSSMKTSLTMSMTTIGALIVGYVISTSTAIREMFLIMFIGLLVDLVYTYWTNSGILLSYTKRRANG
ncbi:MAG TPA: hypothetical protein VJJ75_02260 [Candidatus Nanoarchaeia archaeon]|nr:hypothetical protein [Candidatus Nanoarchaeia archaeon]